MSNKDFKLQKLLEVKELIEKIQQRELSAVKWRLHTSEKELRSIENEKSEFTRAMGKFKNPSVSQVMRNFDYLITLSENISEKNSDVEKLREEVEQSRERLLQAKKERQILENLKDKVVQQMLMEKKRTEQKFLDEISSRKFSNAE